MNSIKDIFKKLISGGTPKEEPPEVPQTTPLSPKDQATANKEPWVAVLDTHVNKDNIRNGLQDSLEKTTRLSLINGLVNCAGTSELKKALIWTVAAAVLLI